MLHKLLFLTVFSIISLGGVLNTYSTSIPESILSSNFLIEKGIPDPNLIDLSSDENYLEAQFDFFGPHHGPASIYPSDEHDLLSENIMLRGPATQGP